MSKIKVSSLILEQLAQERRVIVADWRFHIAYLRVARIRNDPLPDTGKVTGLIRGLLKNREIRPLDEVNGVFCVTVPYASILPVSQEIILQEAHPAAVFSHFTAVAHHNLTDELPQGIYLTHFKPDTNRLPLGTTPEDWIDVPKARYRTPKQLDNIPIEWLQTKAEWDFGMMVGYEQGIPIYITDVERTLLDILRFPDRSGGALEVIRVWKRAAKRLRIPILIDYVMRFDQTLLRQRVGFLLELLGFNHPSLDNWASKSVRGSSAKLFANLDFAPTFSERWNLSINIPDSILSETLEHE